ncbi:hypothetical protein [Psychroflexus sp. MES1-P1E]|uniref:hypothetical protein n=1 Tax=Psychroflexus sp. MES1-P1E TaxID=2058320 RepID=UPI0011AE1EB9|nr:hypothetical protein [Psychroflexus sp. MES1-P1E]
MKNFILHVSILMVFVLITIAFILHLADGQSDPFYLKISSPKQSNFILGTSKSAQGLQPKYFEDVLNKSFYNYSFTIGVSPYGKTYLGSIKNKLDTLNKNTINIITVDIWSISSKTKNPNDSLHFRETYSFLKNVTNVTDNPNYKYLINYFESKYYNILINKSPFLLHNDGWLEIFISNNTNIERKTSFTLESYKKKVTQYQFSSIRLKYLIKTINTLKKNGRVFIVRLPIHPELSTIENEIEINFNSLIKPAIEASNGYLDMSSYNEKCSYTDGVHLNKESGEVVSNIISNWIKNMK